jgi:hypothetical protein
MAQEDQDLAELNDLLGVDVAGRLENEEHGLAVDLELWPLVGVDCVLDGERMKVELAPERVELALRRLVHADPRELSALPARPVGVMELDAAVAAAPVLVDRAVDDHPPELSRSRRARATASSRVRTSPA